MGARLPPRRLVQCPANRPVCSVTADFTARCDPQCGPGKPCAGASQICADGVCIAHPCAATANPCPDPTRPKCSVSAAFARVCSPECDAKLPCPAGKVCAVGRCIPDPCLSTTCAPDQRCVCSLRPTAASPASVAPTCVSRCNSGAGCTASGEKCAQVGATWLCRPIRQLPGGNLGVRARRLAASAGRRELHERP